MTLLSDEQKERMLAGRWTSLVMSLCALVVAGVILLGVHRANQKTIENHSLIRQAETERDDRMFRVAVEAIEESQTKCIIRLDQFGKVAYVNEVAVRELGLRLGETVDNIIPPEYRTAHEGKLSAALAGNGVRITSLECYVNTPNGKRRIKARTWTSEHGAIAILSFLD